MRYISTFWRKLTERALKQSSGKLETAFFEAVYRITYASGLSLSDDHSLRYRIYRMIIKLLIIIFVCSEFWYLFEETDSLDTVIDNINVTIIHLLVMYRYKSMVECKEIYMNLAKAMDTPLFEKTSPARKKLINYWRSINDKYFKILLVLATCTLAIWYTHPLLDDLDYNLVVAMRIPVDHRSPISYPTAYLVTLLMFHYISYFVVVNDLMMQTYLIHMICQFSVLSHCFRNIVGDCHHDKGENFRRNYLKRLRDLVEQHKFLLNNSRELRTILSRPMLCQLAASGMLICLAGYQVTATVTVSISKFLMSLLYLSYNLYGFFVLCKWCDELKTQSTKIGESVYFSGWESGVTFMPEVRTRLMMVVVRASRPVLVTAGGLYEVSLMSYTTLVKTSYSALTVLLRVRQH